MAAGHDALQIDSLDGREGPERVRNVFESLGPAAASETPDTPILNVVRDPSVRRDRRRHAMHEPFGVELSPESPMDQSDHGTVRVVPRGPPHLRRLRMVTPVRDLRPSHGVRSTIRAASRTFARSANTLSRTRPR